MMPRLLPSCACGYDVDASFMSLEQHGRGIHAVIIPARAVPQRLTRFIAPSACHSQLPVWAGPLSERSAYARAIGTGLACNQPEEGGTS